MISPLNLLTILPLLSLGAALHHGRLHMKAVPGPLEWKNRPASFDLHDDSVTISSGPATDWYISPLDGDVSASAPILLFHPSGDFILTTKVTVDFKAKWDAGALFAYASDSVWAKFAFERSYYEESTIVTVVTRDVSDDCNSTVLHGNSVWLRMARVGQTLAFYASPDSSGWKLVRGFTFGSNADVRVGFEAQSPAGAGATAVFSDITYSPRTVQDVFRGE
jgi:uncharacterized protein